MDREITEAIRSKRTDVYVSVLTSLTNQIEDYDKKNYDECMKCFTFIGGLFTIICAVLSVGELESATKNLLIRYITLFIVIIITIFIYNFSMNCRRSAVLRGYTRFLEEQINENLNEKAMLYNGPIISEEIAKFRVNRLGPIALVLALVGLFFLSVLAITSFVKVEPQGAGMVGFLTYKFFPLFILFVCGIACFIFGYSLVKNDHVIARVKKMCDDIHADSLEGSNESWFEKFFGKP